MPRVAWSTKTAMATSPTTAPTRASRGRSGSAGGGGGNGAGGGGAAATAGAGARRDGRKIGRSRVTLSDVSGIALTLGARWTFRPRDVGNRFAQNRRDLARPAHAKIGGRLAQTSREAVRVERRLRTK